MPAKPKSTTAKAATGAKRAPAKRQTTRRTSSRKPAAGKSSKASKIPDVDLGAFGARVVSIFGPFANSTLIMLPTDKAAALFKDPLEVSGGSAVLEGVERDLAAIAKRDKDLASSAIAESARSLALQLDHPYNSATSKSMCAARLREAMDRLFELAPPERKADGVDQLRARRTARQRRSAS